MKPTASVDVQSALFDFTQACFIGEPAARDLTLQPDAEKWLFERFALGEVLTVQEVAQWPQPKKAALRELMTQYLMFATLFNSLPYPDGFLEGCSATQLGHAVQAWIAERRWPFPQRLQNR
jgi:hypothetical protein